MGRGRYPKDHLARVSRPPKSFRSVARELACTRSIPLRKVQMKKGDSKELMKFKAESVLRRAIRLRAALDDVDQQDVIVEALERFLVEEIADVKRRDQVADSKPAEESRKQTRKK